MPEPQLAEEADESSGEEPGDDFGFDGVEESPPEVQRVDLGTEDDSIVDGFDGVEGDEREEEPSEEAAEDAGWSGRSERAPTIEEAIESGLAEVSAVGLRGRQRQQMQMEMQAVASKFHIGYFGREVGEKYLKRDLDDIPPEYGLAAALIAFTAVTLYKRPDGREKVEEAARTIRSQFSDRTATPTSTESSESETESESEETNE